MGKRRQEQVKCVACGSIALKAASEVARSARLGRPQFCGRTCAAVFFNAARKSVALVVSCPCGREVLTSTSAKATRHCSRDCASKFSMSDARREAQRSSGLEHQGNLSVASSLRTREAWKYADVAQALEGRRVRFEHAIGDHVFDLLLEDERILVEFDGPYHDDGLQREVDRKKMAAAEAAGYVVLRRRVPANHVIAAKFVEGI